MAAAKILSICIASYGDDVSDLLQELQYCLEFDTPAHWTVEILVVDQFHTAHPQSEHWKTLPHTQYLLNDQNKGRSGNRNFLAEKATGTHLLFLDADALPMGHSFVANYCHALENHPVVVGGTAYRPGYKHLSLRVRIGLIKEQKSAKVRNLKPYASFSAFNFAIDRPIFLRNAFDASLVQYGHEDTLFGLALRHDVQPILHIDNPAYHMGIDTDVDFMKKSQLAIENMAQLIQNGKVDEDVQIFATYKTLHKFKLVGLMKFGHRILGNPLLLRLQEGKGPLIFYDLYKLLYLCSQDITMPRKMP